MLFEKNKDIYEYFVCPRCYYTMDKCTCDIEAYPNYCAVMIDKGMQEQIRILNKKDYFTLYCCESHDAKDTIYIKFRDKFGLGKSIDVPSGFELDKKNNQIEYSYDKNITQEEFEKEKEKQLAILLDWCKSLPECKKHELFIR